MTGIGAGMHAVNLCWGPINVVCQAAGGVVGGTAQAAEKGILDVIAGAVDDAAKAIVGGMLSALNATTAVDFGAAWLSTQAKVMGLVATPFVVVFFLLQLIGSALRREPGGLVRGVVGVGKAFIGGAAAIPILQLTVVASDQMCDLVVGRTGGGIAALAGRLFVVSWVNPIGGPVLAVILACWAIVSAFLLWGVLLFRKALLLVTGAFTLIAFAGASWDATRGWVRRWVEVAAALVFSKLVIVVVLATGINAMGISGGSGEPAGATLSDVFAGLLLLTVATLAPWLCWQFVHWSGAEIAAGMHQTMTRSPVPQAGRQAGQMAKLAAVTALTRNPGATMAAAASSRGRSGSGGAPRAGAVPRPPTPPTGSAGPARTASGNVSGRRA